MDEKLIADFQLQMMRDAGLKTSDKVYEIGAGTGRLLESLIPFLLKDENSSYFGTDVVADCVLFANIRITRIAPSWNSRFMVKKVTDSETPDPNFEKGPDFICAFSVFTHMEAEDIVLKLMALKSISHTNTIGLFTFLPLENIFGRACFEGEMALAPEDRFMRVRNVAFTRDMAIQLAEIAGWSLIDDYWTELPQSFEDDIPKINQSWLILKPNYN
jgi:hypothetical protein